MLFVLIVVVCCLSFVQIIDSKEYSILVDDSILPHTDQSVQSYLAYLSTDHLILEQIDDENVQIGGYLEAIKSFDRNLPVKVAARTQTYEKAAWKDAMYQYTVPNACFEANNPQNYVYNITKLWDATVCPPQNGAKLHIDSQRINIRRDVPATVPIVPWRIYVLVTQGLPGIETLKFGFGLQFQFLPITS